MKDLIDKVECEKTKQRSIESLENDIECMRMELEKAKEQIATNKTKIRFLQAQEKWLRRFVQQVRRNFKWINIYLAFRERRYLKKVETYIKARQMFDQEYYRSNYQDIQSDQIDPIHHFIAEGSDEHRKPNEVFDTGYYLTQYFDVRKSCINPLYHYIRYGFREGRKPSATCDMYLEWCKFSGERNKLHKFISDTKSAYVIHRSGLFDGAWYFEQYADVREAMTERKLWKLRTSRYSSLRFIGKMVTSGITHYVRYGAYEGRDPNPNFNTSYYLNNNLDLLQSKYLNPFAHYVSFGIKENRSAHRVEEASFQTVLDSYTHEQFRKNRDTVLKEKVSIIIGKGTEKAEFTQRLNSVYNQTYNNIEVIILDCDNQKEITEIIKKYHCQYPQKTKIVKYSNTTDPKTSHMQAAMNQATAKILWLVGEGSTCDSKIVEKLVIYFADEEVMISSCSTLNQGKEMSNEDTGDEECRVYINTAFMEVHQAVDYNGTLFEMGASLFRNPTIGTWYLNQKWELEGDESFTNFALNLIAGGKIVRLPLLLHSKPNESKDSKAKPCIANPLCKQRLQRLCLLKELYNVPVTRIKENYESARNSYLLFAGKNIDYFTGLFDISQVFAYKTKPNILISLIAFTFGGGEIMPIRLANQFKEMGYPVIVHNYQLEPDEEKVRSMLRRDIPVLVTNKTNEMATLLKMHGVDVVSTHHQGTQSFIARVLKRHEDLAEHICHVATTHGMYEDFADDTLKLIVDSVFDAVDYWTYVADKNTVPFKNCGLYQPETFHKIPNGMRLPEIKPLTRENLGLNSDAFTLCIVSRAIPEKGWEQAIQAVRLARKRTELDIQILLIGEGPVYDQLMKQSLESFIHPLGFRDNPCDYYSISDVCVLPSYYRSESAPLSIVEALLCGIPVISSNVGDVKQMLTVNGEVAGVIFDLNNWTVPVDALAEIIISLATDREKYQKVKYLATQKSKDFDIEHVARQYLNVFTKKIVQKEDSDIEEVCLKQINDENLLLSNSARGTNSLKVSVLVPNYNHEIFLKTRLDSIYNQTYKNIEVILMDDFSKDNSRAILMDYAEKYPDITKVLFNESNSGGVFNQWRKGIQNATGDLCWIAESDDYCDVNFLEKTVASFADSKVKISYCKYVFVDAEGNQSIEGFLRYVGEVDDTKWKTSYVNNAENEVGTALSVKNTIPNASGVVFRHPGDLELFKNADWFKMKICGDWVFYLHIIRGGKVAYTVDTLSYFRFHNNNSSIATYSRPDYYKEHETVAYTIQDLYNVSEKALMRNYAIICKFYKQHIKGDEMDLKKWFDIEKVFSRKNKEIGTFSVVGKEKTDFVVPEGSAKIMNTVMINPIFSAGRNLDSNVEEKVKFTGNNTGNLLFVESMKEQLNYCKETWTRASDFKGLSDISAVMPSSNFIIHGGDDFIMQCTALLENTSFPITLAGLGAQSTKDLNTPKKLVAVISPAKLRFFKMISERAVTLGVRGDFTAQCLEEMGIHNFRIIGCPSAFKHLDGTYKELKQPTPEKPLIHITTGNVYETKILKLGMEAQAKWIMQMMTELPEMALEGKLADTKWVKYRFPDLGLEPKQLQTYMEDNAKMFFRINDWNEYLKKESFTFSFGTRFHGNMCALRNGIPALWLVHDSRTTELVRTLRLPYIDFQSFDRVKNIQELSEMCNYNQFYENYRNLTLQYVKFLDENNLDHKFKITR